MTREQIVAAAREVADSARQSTAWNYDHAENAAGMAVAQAFDRFASLIEITEEAA